MERKFLLISNETRFLKMRKKDLVSLCFNPQFLEDLIKFFRIFLRDLCKPSFYGKGEELKLSRWGIESFPPLAKWVMRVPPSAPLHQGLPELVNVFSLDGAP